jgi:hypothetical protein
VTKQEDYVKQKRGAYVIINISEFFMTSVSRLFTAERQDDCMNWV